MKYDKNWLKEYTAPEIKPEILEQLGFGIETINDQIIDLEITSNRGDCLSIIGLAREINAANDQPLPQYPAIKLDQKVHTIKSKSIEIKINSPLVWRFCGAIIKGCHIGKSPEKVKQRLRQMTIRPLANIIDITNYVMLELGIPLHAFDLRKIRGGRFNLLSARGNETIMTLDGQNRQLPKGALIVKDAEKIIDLAGIMGGFHSDIDEKTTDIFLQAAVFQPSIIRRTSRAINLSTEASYRYERGIDYNGCLSALSRSAAMIQELCGGQLTEWFDWELSKPTEKIIKLNFSKVEKLLGNKIDSAKINDYLINLGLKSIPNYQLPVSGYSIPSWRHDLAIHEDLIEEIARLYGYHNLSRQLITVALRSKVLTGYDQRRQIKNYLVAHGWTEVINYSFISRQLVSWSGIREQEWLVVKNPLSLEQEIMRPNLLISVVKSLAVNPDDRSMPVFEIGKIFSRPNRESWQIGLAQWQGTNVLQKILPLEKITIIGLDHPLAEYFTLRKPIEIIEIPWEKFWQKYGDKMTEAPPYHTVATQKFQPVSKFPALRRDLALIVDKSVSPEKIIEVIYNVSPYIFLVELFDQFFHPRFGNHKHSLAFRIIYQDLAKTMTNEVVDKIQREIVNLLQQKFDAVSRK